MSCGQFKKFSLGKMCPDGFRKHILECPQCQNHVKEDARLMDLSISLKETIHAPALWGRIEEELKSEQHEPINISRKKVTHRFSPLLQVSALIVVTIGIGIFLLLGPTTVRTRLLDDQALKRVEQKEKEYIAAITELEKRIPSKFADLSMELVYLYRDRLRTIDDQIDRLREALKENPSNNHIRRYMLAALQDKKQTLHDMLSIQQNIY